MNWIISSCRDESLPFAISTSGPSQPYLCHECIPNVCASQAQIFYVKLAEKRASVVDHLFMALRAGSQGVVVKALIEHGRAQSPAVVAVDRVTGAAVKG